MKRSDAIRELEACVAKRPDWVWHGTLALAKLPAGIEPKLVERALRTTSEYIDPSVFARLPAEYVPVAWRVIAKLKTGQARFLQSFEGDDPTERLHAGGACLVALGALCGLGALGTAKKLDAVAKNANAVAAAQAAVVATGGEHAGFVALLAHDGDDASIDALIPVIDHALKNGGKELDRLADLLRSARGPRLATIRRELEAALAKRNDDAPVLALARSFGERGARMKLDLQIDSVQRGAWRTRKASAWIVLDSTRMPNVAATVSWNAYNHLSTHWEDGTLVRNVVKVGAPRGLEDLPRWLAASAKKLGIRWDRATLRVTSTLRGKVRNAAVAWLLPS